MSSSAIHKQQQPETFCQSTIYLQGLPPSISRVYHHLSPGFTTIYLQGFQPVVHILMGVHSRLPRGPSASEEIFWRCSVKKT